EILTSEEIRRFINSELLKRDCMPVKDTITSSSDQACDVHFFGSGPLKANSAIIIDIFPRSLKTKYWSDMTRTVVKGKASPELKKLYNTVLAGQKKALAIVKAGVSGAEIDKIIRDFFIKEGYQTKEIKGKMQGFVHGTGHGVGLDIHEEPRIHQENRILLKAGNVITIEPGLYYLGLGGVRIEDTVAVTEEGCLNLAKFPKQLLEL
ncbi:MAG: aminopeptidase P family protein, partial [Spirochaetes bacterium]|nr:aminopeptidase P family protein [Spirochaetota bacterium]